ncbi:hypothetical protein ARMSODRAFT_1070889 [Armillaria solidipes]|uniref:F-box domain-containing protein n=1 Tax=Armillaria solidipes TaxID=1076256 RepID=A0A2H3AM17_9AGAR|nr:hypothetical protein ARMSODRAFT_1070889 [Armillaria solidipes]
MSTPASIPATAVQPSKRKHSHHLSARLSSSATVPAPVVGPPYTQAVLADAVEDVPPQKKKVRSHRSNHSTRMVSAESAAGYASSALAEPGRAAFHELPAVSISHPVGIAAQTLRRRVSYGELGPDEVSALDAPASTGCVASIAGIQPAGLEYPGEGADRSPSVCYDASEDGSSDLLSGWLTLFDSSVEQNAFIDDIADENSDCSASVSGEESLSGSGESDDEADEVAVGTESSAVTSMSSVAVSHVHSQHPVSVASREPVDQTSIRASGRAKTKTERGRYVDTMIQNGMAQLVASSGYVKDDPSVPGPSRKTTKARRSPIDQPSALAPHDGAGPVVVDTPVKTLVLSGEAPFISASGAGVQAVLATASSIVAAALSGSGEVRTDSFLDTLDALIGSTTHEASDGDDGDIGVDPVTSTPGVGGQSGSNPSEPEDEGSRVMLIELQEEQLVAYYGTLPGLGIFRPMIPIGSTVDAFEQPPFIMLDPTVASLFNRDALRSVMAVRMFNGHGQFCNLSTMPLTAFSTDGRKLICSARTAVSMIVGVIVGSNLVGPTSVGGKTVHGVRILPFIQPWRRETTALGVLFGFTTGHSENIRSDGIDFTTRAVSLVNPASNNNIHPSPLVVQPPPSGPKTASGSKAGTTGRPSWPKSPTKSPTKPSGLNSRVPRDFYHCLGFGDEIPVYDGRASRGRHFLFRPGDFDQIATMPRVPPNKELDRFTLVAIGYTPSVWALTPQYPRISLNVQFVVVLGQAPKPEALATAGYAGVREMYERCSSNLLSTMSTDDIRIGSDGVYISEVVTASEFIVFGYLERGTSDGLQRLRPAFQTGGWFMLRHEAQYSPDAVLYDNQVRFLTALERRDWTKQSASYVSCVVSDDAPRILVYVDYGHVSVYAPWGDEPEGRFVVSSQDALLRHAAHHLVEMKIELRHFSDVCSGVEHPLWMVLYLDYAMMGHALDEYDDTVSMSDTWSLIHKGTHLYYRYMACLIELANKSGSLLSASFGYRRGIIRAYTCRDGTDDVSLSLRLPGDRTVSSLYADLMPEEVWDYVFSFLPHSVQMASRTVCSSWCYLLTRRTHVYLVLSLPDRWWDIVSPDADKDLVSFLREYAVEAEVDLSAIIVRRRLQDVVRGFRLRNWPVFPYNFFLHLCTGVETVVIEDSGLRRDKARPSTIPCPFLLPASVVDLTIRRVSLHGYSIEGMLDPNGHLARLHIDSIHEGALHLPDSPSLSPADLSYVRDSLAFNSFRGQYIVAPPPASLRYLKLDILMDPYGLQIQNHVLQPHLEGGFALMHQLFQSVLGRGTQYYGDVSYLWPAMSHSLTVLTIRLRACFVFPIFSARLIVAEHHSGGFVSHMELGALDVLSTLNVFAPYRNVYVAMRMVSTWASSRKELTSSVLRLELEIDTLSRIRLGTIIDVAYMKRHLEGTAKNGGFAFKGDFYLCLRSPDWIIHDADHDDAVSFIVLVSPLICDRLICLRGIMLVTLPLLVGRLPSPCGLVVFIHIWSPYSHGVLNDSATARCDARYNRMPAALSTYSSILLAQCHPLSSLLRFPSSVKMSIASYGSVLATVGSFGVVEYLDLIDLIGRVEADFSFPDIIDAYNDGSHPYFRYQASVLALSDADGEKFYASMLGIICHFECKYPQAVMSETSLPRYGSLLSAGVLHHDPDPLPLEILERIMLLCAQKERLVSRSYWANGPECKKDAELYAFAREFVAVYIAYKWRFPAWVRSVSYVNWPATPVPFFYRVFPHVESVVYHGKTCRLRNYPVIQYPQILPPSILSLRIVRCSLKGHSVEYLLAMCRSIRSIALHSVYYGHIPTMLARPVELDDARQWLMQRDVVATSPVGLYGILAIFGQNGHSGSFGASSGYWHKSEPSGEVWGPWGVGKKGKIVKNNGKSHKIRVWGVLRASDRFENLTNEFPGLEYP